MHVRVRRIRTAPKRVEEENRGLPVDFVILFRMLAAPVAFFQLDPVISGQHLHRFHEVQIVILLHEADDVAALAATEALIRLPAFVNRKRRCLFIVEGTKSFIRTSCLLQSHDSANDIYDVAPAFDFFYVAEIV